MDTILVEKIQGSVVIKNSMFEEDLSSTEKIDNRFGTPAICRMQQTTIERIPDYLDQGIDITQTPLYRHLNQIE